MAVQWQGKTNVGGQLGVSPGSEITGEYIFAADPVDSGIALPVVSASAKDDASLAYFDAAGRDKDFVVIPTVNIGGNTYSPGLYRTAGELAISSGDLTLSGKGVYIFQMASTFKVGEI
jgi:hypothetical protein